MSFEPKKYHEGKILSLAMGASATLTKGSHCKMTSGYLAAGAAGDNEAEYIAMETKTSSSVAGADFCLVLPCDDAIEWEAATDIDIVVATHVGIDVDFKTAASLELGATTDKVFHIDSAKAPLTGRIVRGHFNKPALA